MTTENIVLNNNSEISVIATDSARGGNIRINNAKNIILRNNSQIIADAVAGDGGNISISTQGLFSDLGSNISASSQFGLDGNVNVETINGDRTLELTQLPQSPIDATEIVTQGCSVSEDFVITGRGGLPTNPAQHLSGTTVWQDLRTPKINLAQVPPETSSILLAENSNQISEASTWQVNSQGNIELLAEHSPHSQNKVLNLQQQCLNSQIF